MTELFNTMLNFKEWEMYIFLFVTITIFSALSRGKEAFVWSSGLKKSALVNFTYLQFMVYFGAAFYILEKPVSYGYDLVGFPQISSEFWDGVPFPLMCLALLFVYDASLYWIHRALHQSWLWPMHAVHHSDTDMHFLSWSRGHAIEQTFIGICLIFTATWMGLGIEDIAGLAMIRALHQYYVHSNIDWDHGPFRLFIVSPQYHRWHHVDHPEIYDKNFASIFPILDKIFGTYHYPGSAKNMPTGFEGTPGHNLVSLILYPFQEWARMISEASETRRKIREADVLESAPQRAGNTVVNSLSVSAIDGNS